MSEITCASDTPTPAFSAVSAATCLPPLRKEYRERQRRVDAWYAPARFGLFFHWGMFTGGQGSSTGKENPLRYNSVEDFEAAAKDPEELAANMVAVVKKAGARYLISTSWSPPHRQGVTWLCRITAARLRRSWTCAAASRRNSATACLGDCPRARACWASGMWIGMTCPSSAPRSSRSRWRDQFGQDDRAVAGHHAGQEVAMRRHASRDRQGDALALDANLYGAGAGGRAFGQTRLGGVRPAMLSQPGSDGAQRRNIAGMETAIR